MVLKINKSLIYKELIGIDLVTHLFLYLEMKVLVMIHNGENISSTTSITESNEKGAIAIAMLVK